MWHDATVSKTKSVGLYGRAWPSRPDPQREIWVYDAALSVLLAQVIRMVEDMPAQGRPHWWAGCENDLRVQCAISDFVFDLYLGLNDAQREQFARLLENASDALLRRQTVTPEEAAGWRVLDDLPVIFRGSEPQDTQPIAELGRALAGLIRGSLPAPPPQTLWFYGAPGGRTTANLGGRASSNSAGAPIRGQMTRAKICAHNDH
jgi:hypothetical protein